MRDTKGITLIALIITIIVLLILAGVAISMITGGEGLFKQAKGAAETYNEGAKKEANIINDLQENFSIEPVNNGEFNSTTGINTPDTSKLPVETTKYMTWSEKSGTYSPEESDKVPGDWYDYHTGKWANIKTTSEDKKLEAYWVWIPRFAYKLPESNTAKEIEVIFVKGNGKEGANGEKCYYATDSEITTGGTGLYINKTANATNEWIIHPAFTFGDKQLNGIWIAKYEASNNENKVEVKDGVTSWRSTTPSNSFNVCRGMQDTGGALGTETGTTTIDTHMAKNMEWAAVSVLSQSKYGIFNPKSATGINGDKTYKVWNNPNTSYITGTIGETADAGNVADGNCTRYNTGNGPKASTTGTVYGVYDMAGGAWEQVMGIMESSSGSNVPSSASTGFNKWPDKKYYDIYPYGETHNDAAAYNRGKIGDLTRELNPASEYTWNNDFARFVCINYPLFCRGGYFNDGAHAGAFSFVRNTGVALTSASFRPVLVAVK